MMNKKVRNSVIAAAMIAVIGIGGSLAYMSTKTDVKTNTFTMGAGVTGQVVEDKWDSEGMEQAKNFVPGRVISKDPVILNTSDAEKAPAVYAAVKLDYTGVANGTELMKFADIDWNTKDWSFNADYTMAYYTGDTWTDNKTTKVFNTITIKDLALTAAQIASADEEVVQFDKTKYENNDWANYEMKDFTIGVQGYLVQKEGFASVQDAMQKAFPTVFPSTVTE